MPLFIALNLGLRFLLELCMLGAFGFWGFATGTQTFSRFVLGIGLPLLVATFWGLFLAPSSPRQLAEPWFSFVELVLFGFAIWALYCSGQVQWAIIFGGVYLANKSLLLILERRYASKGGLLANSGLPGKRPN